MNINALLFIIKTKHLQICYYKQLEVFPLKGTEIRGITIVINTRWNKFKQL